MKNYLIYFKIILFAVPYILLHGMECLLNININTLNAELGLDKCEQWCTDNEHCGGFTIYKDMCYFKNQSCKNNLVISDERFTVIKYKG